MSSEIRLDIRIPIGALFAIVGAILAIFGLVSDKQIYERSMNININLWWGLFMFAFGVIFLITAFLSMRAAKTNTKDNTNENN
jgi:protein-S-isoprenylcysteine O-methyltransferase Ste14